MAEQNALVRFVSKFNRKRLTWVLMILGVIPIFVVIGLPLPVTSTTKDFKAAVDGVAAAYPGTTSGTGAKCFYVCFDVCSPLSEFKDRYASLMGYFASKHIRMVFLPLMTAAVAAYVKFETEYAGLESKYGYVYGVDYVIMPFLEGEEAAFAGAADTFRTAYRNDQFGTPIDQLPLLNGINTMNDFQIEFDGYHSWEHTPDMAARTWWMKYPNVIHVTAGKMTNTRPYYGTYIKGMLDSLPAYGEWEYLTGYAGIDIMFNDTSNLTGIATIIIIVLGTISFQIERKSIKGPIAGMIGEPVDKERGGKK